MAITWNAGTSGKIRTLIGTVWQMLGQSNLNLANSASFRMVLESRNGDDLYAQVIPLDKGVTPDPVKITNPVTLVTPSGGAADIDGAYGTAALVNSVVSVTVPSPSEGGAAVPDTALLLAWPTIPAGVVAPLNVWKTSDTTIKISSKGKTFAPAGDADTKNQALVAGTAAITMNEAVATTDLIFVEQVSAGGDAANHYSGYRSGANAITVFAHTAAGAAVAGNTATVRVHKVPASSNSRVSATGTLVAGTADIALANTAGDRLVVEQVTAGGTAANHFCAVRKDASTVTVFAVTVAGAKQALNTSAVRVWNLGAPDCVTGTLVAGTLDVAMASTAGDLFVVREITAGGGAAACYSANRKSATEVTLNAQTAAGALVATSTSVVRVYKVGQANVDTSTVRWAVIRP